MSSTFDFRPSHNCGTLNKKNDGDQVTLSGWVHRRRDHGGLIFIDLRDLYGITQIVFDPEHDSEAHKVAEKLRAEFVISVQGIVVLRNSENKNPKMATGEIEVEIEKVEILSKSKTPPFSICDDFIEVNEELRLKYRYLDIRRGTIAEKLILRHKAMLTIRHFLDTKGFIEIATPILGKSTPEGARDYLVPSRVHPGTFYALPQSPQIFKQLLMVSGMNKYFQIAQCFRDEDLRADRQPEFTQVDIEMSFAYPDDLISIIEELIKNIFKACINVEVLAPFKRLSHQTCMDKYGCDKPDLRFGMELVQIDDIAKRSNFQVFLDQLNEGGIVKGLNVKGGQDLSRKMIDDYTKFVSHFGIKGLAWMKRQDGSLVSNITKFFSKELQDELITEMEIEEGDLIFMVADQKPKVNLALSHLRKEIAKDRNLIDPKKFEFLWVVDFPLFSWNEDENRLDSEHHPFTSPNSSDLHLIDTDPLKMRSSGYDIVLNGYEIGGGSQRIHDSNLQQKIFEKLDLKPQDLEAKFGFFLEALSYGTPPHLGIALGLDRLMMILSGTENIRDVIAFPKTQKASDLMLQCPSQVAMNQLKELKITSDI